MLAHRVYYILAIEIKRPFFLFLQVIIVVPGPAARIYSSDITWVYESLIAFIFLGKIVYIYARKDHIIQT